MASTSLNLCFLFLFQESCSPCWYLDQPADLSWALSVPKSMWMQSSLTQVRTVYPFLTTVHKCSLHHKAPLSLRVLTFLLSSSLHASASVAGGSPANGGKNVSVSQFRVPGLECVPHQCLPTGWITRLVDFTPQIWVFLICRLRVTTMPSALQGFRKN